MIKDDFIYCDCCGSQKLAQVVGDSLVIKDRRHGQKHVAILKADDLLDILKKTPDNTSKDQVAEKAAKI